MLTQVLLRRRFFLCFVFRFGSRSLSAHCCDVHALYAYKYDGYTRQCGEEAEKSVCILFLYDMTHVERNTSRNLVVFSVK